MPLPSGQIIKNPVGHPIKMTTEILSKLREAYLIGATDREAVAYADISHQTLYNYQKDHPEFIEQKESWKETPILAARNKVVGDLKTDVVTARWYLERKRRLEFGPDKDEDEGGIKNQLNIFMGNNEAFPERLAQLLGGFKPGSGDREVKRDDSDSTPGSGVGSNS